MQIAKLNYLLCRNFLLPSLGHHSPLKDRVLKVSDSTSTCSSGLRNYVSRNINYRTWTELSMREALNSVQQGMSVSKASVIHGIPRSTLKDHVHGRVVPGAKPGAPTLLSSSEERDLVEFLCNCASIGYGKTRQDVMTIVSRMLTGKGEKRSVTSGWWSKFIARHHRELSLRTPATLSLSRASASSQASIDNYFDILEHSLLSTGLHNYPALIFNMDESGFPLDPKPLKTIDSRGSRNPYCISSGSKSQVSVAACVSAAGQSLPPYIIWKRKTMCPDMAIGELPGTEYGLSEKGWMNGVLFKAWFRKVFLRYAPASRPILLLLDGLSSHYNPDTIKLATENEVIIFTLPPNTTHITQPLDKGVFGPFKAHWKLVCHDYLLSHPGHVINPYNFVQLFSKAWLESMTAANIAAGFEVTGIYPLNRQAVHLPSDSHAPEERVVPRDTYTPFKRYAESDHVMFSSSDLHASPTLDVPQRPNSLRTIATVPSPKLKTVPLSDITNRVISSHGAVGVKSNESEKPSVGKKQTSLRGKTCMSIIYILVITPH